MSKPKLPEWCWIDDKGAMHLDGPLYAKLRGISLDEAVKEMRKMMQELLPDAEIHERD